MIKFQLLAILILLAIAFKTYLRYQKKQISNQIFIFWLSLWFISAFLVAIPDFASKIAYHLGIGRGVDLVIYIAIGLIFYIQFKLFLKIEDIEKNITDIVRHEAVERPIKEKNSYE